MDCLNFVEERQCENLANTADASQNPVGVWIEVTPILGHGATAGTAVDKDDGLTFGVSALFVVDLVSLGYFQKPGLVRLDWIIKFAHASSPGLGRG